MRTGSNLLESCLAQYAQIECHGELYNRNFIGKESQKSYADFDIAARNQKPSNLIDGLIAANPEKLHGFRIFRDHDQDFLSQVLADRDVGRIVLERNPLDSFLSLKLALANKVWQIGTVEHRKATKITFDPIDYEKYLLMRTEYFAKIRRGLQHSGTTAFWVNYDEVKDIQVLNGIARYLGITQKLQRVREPIKRQNPGSPASKVTNPGDLPAFSTGAQRGNYPKSATFSIRNLSLTAGLPLAYAPILPEPNIDILGWMAAAAKVGQGDASSAVVHNLNGGEYANWRTKVGAPVVFTCVRHPVQRAYDAFIDSSFAGGTEQNLKLRNKIFRTFDGLPDSLLGAEPELIRRAFHHFIGFLSQNLDFQTDVNIDRAWISQTSVVRGLTENLPVSLVAKETHWAAAAEYLARLVGIAPAALPGPTKTQPDVRLSSVYDAETEQMVRRVYAIDYVTFSWPDLPQAACEF